ncbi:MAG: VWA domain-containing protein [Verrucomicrobiales bacterium]|nr:VWA domain-containing protein [Verrucomicrobiales bacterium]
MLKPQDHPDFTAYALNDPSVQDRQRMEDELASSADARAWVEDTRALAEMLKDGFAAEQRELPTPDVRSAVEHRLATLDAGPEGSGTSRSRDKILPMPSAGMGWAGWFIVAAAACVAVGTFVLPLGRGPRPEEVMVLAQKDASRTESTVDRADPKPQEQKSSQAISTERREQPLPLPPPVDPTGLATVTGRVPIEPTATMPLPNMRRGQVPEAGMSPETRARYGLGGPGVSPMPRSDGSQMVDAAIIPEQLGGQFPEKNARLAAPSIGRARTLSAKAEVQSGLSDSAEARSLGDAFQQPIVPELQRRYGLQAPPEQPAPPGFWRRPPNVETYEGRRSSGGAEENPGYMDTGEHGFLSAMEVPLSTFGLDVDTGSYANVRRFLNAGVMPPREAVRIEEMINYFPYDDLRSGSDDTFAVKAEVAGCPWEPSHRLVRIAIQARASQERLPSANLVFLIDVSGSMAPSERLPLLKQALKSLVKRMETTDRVAIVTYATGAGVRLPSTSCEQKDRILEAIDSLEAGGSTNGEGGIREAYEVASAHYIPGGVNRVLLCTDGDFNVGLSRQDDLVGLIREKAGSGVFLTTLGVGTDNFKDALMRRLADSGNGSYHYLDSFEEAQRVLLDQKDATFVVVARDAKAQVEFNPARVGAWRLVGYEKRALAAADFHDDTKDAGEIGAGQRVTVLYEIVPPGVAVTSAGPELKYQRVARSPAPIREVVPSKELMTIKLRHQRPGGSASRLLEIPIVDQGRGWSGATADFKFTASVAAFGMLLKDSPHRGQASYGRVLEMAREGMGRDSGGWRAEFLGLARKAQALSGQK